jgi:excisionase family DNA binding protein
MTTTSNKPQSVSTGITTDNAAMVEPIHTIEDVVDILKVKSVDPKRTVMRWIKEGKLRGFKAGKEWRVTESALNEFINKGGGE